MDWESDEGELKVYTQFDRLGVVFGKLMFCVWAYLCVLWFQLSFWDLRLRLFSSAAFFLSDSAREEEANINFLHLPLSEASWVHCLRFILPAFIVFFSCVR